MSNTLTISEPQVDGLAQKLDGMDLTFEEQAILVAVLAAGEQSEIFASDQLAGNEGEATSETLDLPTPGEGLRNAFAAGKPNPEVSGYVGVCVIK